MKRLLIVLLCTGLMGIAYAAAPVTPYTDCPRWQNAQMQNNPPQAGMRHQGQRQQGMGKNQGQRMMTFDQLDLDQNGVIDPEEFAQHQANRQMNRQQ